MTRLTLDINFVDLGVARKPKYEPSIATSPGETNAKFTTASGQRYHVHVSGKPEAFVLFNAENAREAKHKFGLSGAGGSDTPHILHAVNHVIRAHVRSNPAVEAVAFSAVSSEPSRVKLYKAFANRMDPKHFHYEGGHEHHFFLNANAFRGSK